jgi:hypothetical protein
MKLWNISWNCEKIPSPRSHRFKKFWLRRFTGLRFSWLKFAFALVSSGGHSSLWAQSAKFTADSIEGMMN